MQSHFKRPLNSEFRQIFAAESKMGSPKATDMPYKNSIGMPPCNSKHTKNQQAIHLETPKGLDHESRSPIPYSDATTINYGSHWGGNGTGGHGGAGGQMFTAACPELAHTVCTETASEHCPALTAPVCTAPITDAFPVPGAI